ncbi:MAG: protein-glutamate O-methyltransferase CheR [Phycisphaeraceae bacterium]|nr:protein-glutamate O-methyltransferase CheR [Phycisphaeraceae bacterium]
MEDQVFQAIRKLVYQQSGINLTEAKKSLVVARLIKRQRALNLADEKAYLQYLKQDASGEELVNMIDAISTNVTHFFRESEHFDFVRKTLEHWLDAGRRKFRLWSAASSTGEEPYTLGISMLETLSRRHDGGVDMKILATDISTRVLRTCIEGLYEPEKLDNIPPLLRDRYFQRVDDAGRTMFQIAPPVRKLISFTRLNLSSPPFPMKGPLDIVFCRNVMIYFDNPTRQRLLGEILRLLAPEGYLLVGHAESLSGPLQEGYRRVGPSIYQKAA